MKVLWFANTPCLSEEYLNKESIIGGFLKSIEKVMQQKVDLSIAFYYNKRLAPFKYGKTTYFPVFRNQNGLFSKLKARVFNQIEPESDIKEFLKIIEEVKPDVIQIHGSECPFGLVQDYTSIPCVLSIQGNLSVYELKFFSGIPSFDIFKYAKFKTRIFFTNDLNRFKRFKKQSKREKKILEISNNIIGRTHWDRRITKILSPNAQYYHNDEVLKETFYKGEWRNKLGDTLNLFTTNAANIYKGIETLIYCAHILDNYNIIYNWKVAGIKSNDEIVRIATKSLKIKLSKNIEFLGPADDNKLKESILNCNIYLGISHIENSPNSLCEALILGVPCIATFAGGTSTFIDDGINGILIQDGDPYSLAGAIVELKENYIHAINMGINARKKALERHDKNKIAEDLLKIYYGISIKKHSMNEDQIPLL